MRHEYYFHTDKENPVIIDAGANIGDSMIYFKYLYPQATIYSFEPDVATFAYLSSILYLFIL